MSYLVGGTLAAIFGLSAASSSWQWESHPPGGESVSSDLGGCGWSKCYNCVGGHCGPSNQKCIGAPPKYTFHLADPTCDINDPNGPFYDPVHGMYHNFYQIHIAEYQNGLGDGPDWGHWVSKDFIHWAQLPVAIWNDQYYDNSAIFTGSTTIVNGKPVIMYPGKCKGLGDGKGCNAGKGGFTYVLAVPANASDPLYTEWSKEGDVGGKVFSNPIVNFTGDDPSTAWQTKDGEWRVIGNQACKPEGGNPLYGSMDFVTWYKIGCTTLMAGDCPTFFPLPAITPGSEHYIASHGPMPDHVHKSGGKGGDQVQVGQWTDGKPGPAGTGTVGTWVQTPGTKSVFCDKGKTHASKDFHDPIKKRQILWIWGTVPSGIQAIPRTMTYHPGIKQIVYSPVEEIDALREEQISKLPTTEVKANESVSIKVSGAVDLVLSFTVPTKPTTISVAVGKSNQSFFIKFVPPMGMAPTMSTVGFGHYEDSLPLLADDKSISMRIFLDNVVAECYWQGGRVAMTVPLDNSPSKPSDSAFLSSTEPIQLLSATAYRMGEIMVSKEQVLAMTRPQYI